LQDEETLLDDVDPHCTADLNIPLEDGLDISTAIEVSETEEVVEPIQRVESAPFVEADI
jgi:hypothetical protein